VAPYLLVSVHWPLRLHDLIVSEVQSLSQQQKASQPPVTRSHEQSLKFLFWGETLLDAASIYADAPVTKEGVSSKFIPPSATEARTEIMKDLAERCCFINLN